MQKIFDLVCYDAECLNLCTFTGFERAAERCDFDKVIGGDGGLKGKWGTHKTKYFYLVNFTSFIP